MARTSKAIQETVQGRAGGLAVVKKYGRGYMREIGLRGASAGGNSTYERYGSEYMSALGRLGANATNGHLSKTALLNTERAVRRILRENG